MNSQSLNYTKVLQKKKQTSEKNAANLFSPSAINDDRAHERMGVRRKEEKEKSTKKRRWIK